MKKILACLALLIFGGFSLADIEIAKENRVENQDPGYCSWCAIETLGRHHNVKKLHGLVEARKKDSDVTILENGYWRTYKANSGYDWTIKEKLNKMGVKYKYGNTGSYDTKLIKYAMDNDLGWVGSVKSGALGKSAHSVTVISYNSKEVRYIDPNDLKIYKSTREWWDHWWDGSVIVIEKEAAPKLPPVRVAKKEDPTKVKPVIIGLEQPKQPAVKASTIPEDKRVRPVIIGLDLKEIDPTSLQKPAQTPARSTPIMQWRLTNRKE